MNFLLVWKQEEPLFYVPPMLIFVSKRMAPMGEREFVSGVVRTFSEDC